MDMYDNLEDKDSAPSSTRPSCEAGAVGQDRRQQRAWMTARLFPQLLLPALLPLLPCVRRGEHARP